MRSPAEWARAALLLLAAALPYLNALPNGFAFDDRGMILENPVIQRGAAPLLELFTRPYSPGALYRPLTFASFWLNQHLHGLTPFGFHAVNLLLHLIATWLVYRLCLSMRLGTTLALVAGLVFAVHPIHTEAVASAVGRAEQLSAICVLGALLCAARSRREEVTRWVWLAAAAALFAAGLLSKENAFVFLPLLVVAAWIGERRSFRELLVSLNLSGELPLFACIGVAYLALRWTLFGTLTVGETISWLDNPLAHSPAAVRVGTALVVLVDSLAQLILPLRLSADYSFNQVPLIESLGDPRLLVALALLTGLTLLLWRLRATAPSVVGGAVFFLAAFSLTSNLFFPIGTIRAERLLYLPSVGFSVVFAAVAAQALRRRPRWAVAALSLVLLAYVARTWVRNWDWASDATLFAATLATSPYSAKVHHNLGVLAADEKRYKDAALSFRQALQIFPLYEDSAFGIAKMYQDQGMMVGAVRWYGETIKIDGNHFKAHLNLGAIHFNAGDLAAAESAFRASQAIRPDDPRPLTGLGYIRLAEGRVEDARIAFEEAHQMDPTGLEPRRGLGLAAERSRTAVLHGS